MITTIIKSNGRQLPFDQERLNSFLNDVLLNFDYLEKEKYLKEVIDSVCSKPQFEANQITNVSILKALDRVDIMSADTDYHPDWTFVASQIYLKKMYRESASHRNYSSSDKYGNFYGLLKYLGTEGIYSSLILRDYTKEEIDNCGKMIDSEKDKLFTYVGLKTLADRYLAKTYDGKITELPQERFMVIAMVLMSKEDKEKRLHLISEAYWALSNLYMTVATPTLTNAGKSYGQLSSCFIDTVDDSLRGIFDSNTDVATLSKGGGGIGVYLGKVRARGSDIKGFKGVSSGIIPWMKQLNNTAVSVDQLGQRQGSIAVYLDVWHKDIEPFLDSKLNNGDERLRTHDLFTGVCIPDVFMEAVEQRKDWFLFDPHEIRTKKGYSLEDFYDEHQGIGSFRQRYFECVDDPNVTKTRVSAIDIMKRIMKSQLETGTPYMFYRDTVNRANPNKHAGMIYSSNLCTEIHQNMSPTTVVSERVSVSTPDEMIVTYKKPGDFVVCNLSSINLGSVNVKDLPDALLQRLIPIQVRMLDNVIDLNTIEVPQAQITNQKYRAIGLGTFGWHHLLSLKKIRWESQEAIDYSFDLYEYIMYLTVKASCDLAKEKGVYPAFEGSDWHNGKFFSTRGLLDKTMCKLAPYWNDLKEEVHNHGLRNGYLMAVAPNGSTSFIGNSTASIDPIFKKVYSEEKKNFKIPVTAPDLSMETYWFYKSAYDIDQKFSIYQNAARQRFIDQGVSFNLYVKNDIKAKDLLELHLEAWKHQIKTTYYVRSTSVEVEDCESCAS
jgi:ribonucleoside-diphosphate reductase alpha chain